MIANRKRLNTLLFTAVVIGICWNWTWTSDTTQPNYLTMPDMVTSPSFPAFSTNPHLPYGKSLQHPPEHSLPIETTRFRYGSSPEEAARAGDELRSPLRVIDDATISRGKEVFETFCFPCHGSEAQGDGPVVQRGFPAPPPLTAEKTVGLKDGQLFHIVTYGQGNMPSYKTLVSPEERWLVIAFVRSLQASRNAQ